MKTSIKVALAVVTLFTATNLAAEKKVHSFTVSRTIKAPAEKVWAVVGDDYGAIAHSHPKIVSSNYLSGTLKSGEGAERVCHFNEKGTKYVKEKQINYDPDNYTFKAQVYHAGGMPLDPNYNFAVYKVEVVDANTCKLVLDMGIRTKPAFMGTMAKGKFKKIIEDYMIAVEHHVLTGEKVTKDNFKEIKARYKS